MRGLDRRGFALLAALWLLTAVSIAAFAAIQITRQGIVTSRNRTQLAEAEWLARGCAAEALAAIDVVLNEDERSRGEVGAWRTLDAVLPRGSSTYCSLEIRPVGLVLNANETDGIRLLRLLFAAGVEEGRAYALRDAILDWRDPDQEARPRGAERAWYRSNGMIPPRDGPFADHRELENVRDIEALSGRDSLLRIEPGRILVDRAPLFVLSTLPGMTDELLVHLERRRRSRLPIMTIDELLPAPGSPALLRTWSELATLEPDAWILTVSAARGSPQLASTLVVRLERAGQRASVARQSQLP